MFLSPVIALWTSDLSMAGSVITFPRSTLLSEVLAFSPDSSKQYFFQTCSVSKFILNISHRIRLLFVCSCRADMQVLFFDLISVTVGLLRT